jgi:hypothetical protein
VFADMLAGIKKDRIGFLSDFGKLFFGVNLVNHPVSTPLLEYYRNLASVALPGPHSNECLPSVILISVTMCRPLPYQH